MLKEISISQTDALNSVIASFSDNIKAKMIGNYMNDYMLNSYFIEKFKKYITPKMFSQASGLTVLLAETYTNLFDKSEYESHPGNIDILFSNSIIKKYDINLKKVFDHHPLIDSSLSQYLLSLDTDYDASIINASSVAFLQRSDVIAKYHDLYDIDTIQRMVSICSTDFETLCHDKKMSLSNLLDLFIDVLKHATGYKYTELLMSIKLDDSEFDAMALASQILILSRKYYTGGIPKSICEFINERIDETKIDQMVDAIRSLTNDDDSGANYLIDILTRQKIIRVAQPTEHIETISQEDFLW